MPVLRGMIGSLRVTMIWVCILSGLAQAADNPEVPLWAAGVPGSEGKTAKEVDEAPNKDQGELTSYLSLSSITLLRS
jgi:hypothetical protein